MIDLIIYAIKWHENNLDNIKHIVGDNHNGTVTVITQVIFKGEIIHEWNETADNRFLNEMKKDHKRDGREYLKKHKAA